MFRFDRGSHQRTGERKLAAEQLETRRLLTASLGWDGPGQGSAELTYYIANSPSGLAQADTDAAIEAALEAWSDVADITFTKTDQPGLADSLDISFAHLDGRGGTLAQAYFPDDVNRSRIAGDIQFDTSENWEIGNDLGRQAFDLVYVAVHEIGHALGLDHASESGSTLAPSVSPLQSFSELSTHDVADIQELYAARTPAPTTHESDGEPTPVSVPSPTLTQPTSTEEPSVEPPSTSLPAPESGRQWRSWFHHWFRFRNWTKDVNVVTSSRNPTSSINRTQVLSFIVFTPTRNRLEPTDAGEVATETLVASRQSPKIIHSFPSIRAAQTNLHTTSEHPKVKQTAESITRETTPSLPSPITGSLRLFVRRRR